MQPMQNVDLPTKDGDMIEYEITIQWLGDFSYLSTAIWGARKRLLEFQRWV